MPTLIAAESLKYGVAGLIALVFGFVIVALWKNNLDLHKTIEALQSLRVTDAQGVTAQLLRMNTECVTALTSVVSGIEAQRDAMGELKTAFERLGEKVDRLRPGSR